MFVENKLLPKQIYLMERQLQGQKLWILANLSDKTVEVPNIVKAAKILYPIRSSLEFNSDKVKFEPLEGAIFC